MAKTKRHKAPRQYGVLNAPPLIVDFKLNMLSGGTTTYGVSYSGPVPKLDVDPREIPTILRALADRLEYMQNGGPAPGFGEAFDIGAAVATASKRRATKQ